MKMGQYERRYLQVDAEFLPDGKVLPKVLYWENEDGTVLPDRKSTRLNSSHD